MTTDTMQPSVSSHVVAALATNDLARIVDAIVERTREHGEIELLLQGHRRRTGSQLGADVHAVAAAFARHGMQAGDVVLFGIRPGIDALVSLLACMRNGSCVTFVDPGAGTELFQQRLDLLQPRWIFAESILYAASARSPLTPYLRRRGLELPRLASLPGTHVRVGRRIPLLVPRSLELGALAAEPPGETSLPAAVPADAASMIIFTSGTTGRPKGVQHTGRSIAGAVRMLLEGFELPSDAIVYTHDVHSLIVTALRGVRSIVSPLSVDPARFLADVEAHGVTHAFVLPVEAWRIALHCERLGRKLPESLQRLFLYSAPITTTVLERIHRNAGPGLSITCAYAMTEMVPVACIESDEKLAWRGDGDVVGRPMPGVQTRIVDDELWLRGPSLFLGYVGHDPVEWHRTGDLARIDDAGHIVLMGRAKDMLIRGDFNLYPGLYEDTVGRIPGVGACAFVGIPNAETSDERVALFVEPDTPDSGRRRDTAALRRRVERGLRSGETRIDAQALPDLVCVVASLPRAGRSHKIDRITLRQRAIEMSL